jgi:hypothetical protein
LQKCPCVKAVAACMQSSVSHHIRMKRCGFYSPSLRLVCPTQSCSCQNTPPPAAARSQGGSCSPWHQGTLLQQQSLRSPEESAITCHAIVTHPIHRPAQLGVDVLYAWYGQ